MNARRFVLLAAGIGAVAAAPLVGRALRSDDRPRCAEDGVAIEPSVRVRLVGKDGRSRVFCCVDCAQRWISESAERPGDVFVADETTGRETPADAAWFVRSRVASFAVTGCHVHAFAAESDARRHAANFGGFVLVGDERPFHGGASR